MKLNESLISEIKQYCEANELDEEKIINDAIRRGFTIIKFGPTPASVLSNETVREIEVIKEVPIEKIIEKIIEVPVEKIIEVIKEVPIEKHIPIEKTINISVDGKQVPYLEYIEQLTNNVSHLEVESKKITKELNDIKINNNSLTSELKTCKAELAQCRKESRSGYDLYGEK